MDSFCDVLLQHGALSVDCLKVVFDPGRYVFLSIAHAPADLGEARSTLRGAPVAQRPFGDAQCVGDVGGGQQAAGAAVWIRLIGGELTPGLRCHLATSGTSRSWMDHSCSGWWAGPVTTCDEA